VSQVAEQSRTRLRALPGREVPHNLEAEESLVGAMLLSRDAIAAALEHVHAEDFFSPRNARIFGAIVSLYERGLPADPVTVAEELARSGDPQAPSAGELIELQVDTPSPGNAEAYARIVADLGVLRRLIGASSEIAKLAYESGEDVAAVVDRAEAMIFEVAERRAKGNLASMRDLLGVALDRLEQLYERGESVTGVPTGFVDLDERLAGLQPANLVVVGARPSMGKTAFALGVAVHAAVSAGVPVLVFSLEMSHAELTQRLLAQVAGVDAMKLRTGRLADSDWPRITDAIGRLGEAPIFIDDTPNLTVMDLRARARRQMARSGLGLIVVDYLQLMASRTKAENRQVEVSEISRGLKILARELNVPVLALSQLSRGLEMRSDKRPVLADLRESGSIEQDADVVLFIYRDELYNPQSSAAGSAEVIIAKHRNGPTGTVQLAFISHYARFANIART
jgi:replicative DNA helicase